jgi:hypothetical protein
VITSTFCNTCYSEIYDPTTSTSAIQDITQEVTLNYGSASVSGYFY